MYVFDSVAITVSNEAQHLFRRFSLCLRTSIAKIYDKQNTTCFDIEMLSKAMFNSCMSDAGFCESIKNSKEYPGLWEKFITHHDLSDIYIYDLLKSLLVQAEQCGEPIYNILAQKWKKYFDENRFLV